MGIPAPPGGHLSELKTVAQMKMLFLVLLFLDRQQNHGSKRNMAGVRNKVLTAPSKGEILCHTKAHSKSSLPYPLGNSSETICNWIVSAS
jgi:hypothetical protein